MQFSNPCENGSCSHGFENLQNTYTLNHDLEVEAAAIFISEMHLYLSKVKALKKHVV